MWQAYATIAERDCCRHKQAERLSRLANWQARMFPLPLPLACSAFPLLMTHSVQSAPQVVYATLSRYQRHFLRLAETGSALAYGTRPRESGTGNVARAAQGKAKRYCLARLRRNLSRALASRKAFSASAVTGSASE